MARALFRSRADEAPTLSTVVAIVTTVVSSVIHRCIDFAILLGRPRLFGAAARVFVAGWRHSPYRESDFAQLHAARGARQSVAELMYGETPVWTAVRLLRRAGLGVGSRLVDIGAGRGRVLLAARRLGAEARGVELNANHVRAVDAAIKRAGATLVVGDGAQADLTEVTHVYLTWTCLSDATRARMTEHLRSVRPGTMVLTLTHPLEDDAFERVGECTGWFTWGLAPVFIQRRTSAIG